jgi:hypothetical protein
MEVKTWSDDDLQEAFSHCITLDDVIRSVEKAASDVGQVVCSIKVNGMKLTEKDELILAHTERVSIKELSVELQDPVELVAKTLKSLRDGMTAIRDRAVQLADEFRAGEFAIAQRGFSSIMEQTQYTMDALRALKPRLKRSENAVSVWSAAEIQSQNMIQELMQAYAHKNYVLLADVLEYELYNTMQAWIGVLDSCHFD